MTSKFSVLKQPVYKSTFLFQSRDCLCLCQSFKTHVCAVSISNPSSSWLHDASDSLSPYFLSSKYCLRLALHTERWLGYKFDISSLPSSKRLWFPVNRLSFFPSQIHDPFISATVESCFEPGIYWTRPLPFWIGQVLRRRVWSCWSGCWRSFPYPVYGWTRVGACAITPKHFGRSVDGHCRILLIPNLATYYRGRRSAMHISISI